MLPTCLSYRELFCCLRSFWISCICTAKAGRGMSQASLSASIGPEAVYLVLQHPRQRSVCSAGWEGRRDGWQSRVTRGAGCVCPAVDGMFWRMVNHKAWICWNNLKIHYFFSPPHCPWVRAIQSILHWGSPNDSFSSFMWNSLCAWGEMGKWMWHS